MTTEQLRNIPLFSTLNPEELNDLLAKLEVEKHPPHTVIFWMDELGDRLYVVEKGQVRISQTNKEGKELSLATLSEGDFFGELSLLDGGPHTATARTITDTSLLTIERASFYSFLDRHPQFSRTLLAVLTDRLRNSTLALRHGRESAPPPPPQPMMFKTFVDKAANYVSSSRFLIFSVLFMGLWMALQTWYFLHHGHASVSFMDSPPAFSFLGFLLTLTSFLFTILVLISQRGLAHQDRIQSEIEYQVNLKAQAEVMRLQLKMDEVLRLLEERQQENNNQGG